MHVNCSPRTNTSSWNSSRTPKLPRTKLGIQMRIFMVQPCGICIPLLPQGEHHIRIGGNSILHHNLLVVAIGTMLWACRASGFIIFRGRNWRAVDDVEPSCWSPWDSTQVFISYFPCSLHTANTWVPLLLAYFYPGLPSWGYWWDPLLQPHDQSSQPKVLSEGPKQLRTPKSTISILNPKIRTIANKYLLKDIDPNQHMLLVNAAKQTTASFRHTILPTIPKKC